MAIIPSRRAGDSSPLRKRHDFNPLATTWSPQRTPHHCSPLSSASEWPAEPRIVPGRPVILKFINRT